jgi:bacillithiol biosynthesis deacetylase BshB1
MALKPQAFRFLRIWHTNQGNISQGSNDRRYKMIIDAIAFGAHPDDAELGCGGLLLKLKAIGYSTGVVDLTEAELSTNGDLPTRQKETEKASELLKLDIRKNLNLMDCNITNDLESRLKVINIVRQYRPALVIIPYKTDRHPDHENSYKLLKDSFFAAGLKKFKTELPEYRPKAVICYMLNYGFQPSFIVDISDYHEQKMKACNAFKSQLYRQPGLDQPTYINSKFFRDYVTGRDKSYVLKIKTEHAEPYFIEDDIKIDDPVSFFKYLS